VKHSHDVSRNGPSLTLTRGRGQRRSGPLRRVRAHLDPPRPRSEWPAIGTEIEVVVLGYTNESRRGHVDRL